MSDRLDSVDFFLVSPIGPPQSNDVGEEVDATHTRQSTTDDSSVDSPNEAIFDDAKVRGTCGFFGYAVSCLLAEGSISLMTVALWSDMGYGEHTMTFLEDHQHYQMFFTAATVFVFVLLYVLDFFWPPHLDGKILQLYTGDQCIGKFICGLALALLVASVMLMANHYPSIPIVLNMFLCPLSVFAVRYLFRPKINISKTTDETVENIFVKGDIHEKMKLLRMIVGQEADEVRFYWASVLSFFLCGVSCLSAWFVWIFVGWGGGGGNGLKTSRNGARGKLIIMLVTPLAVALLNFVFVMLAGVRIYMHRTYTRTDTRKNMLIASALGQSGEDDVKQYHRMILTARATKALDEFEMESGEELAQKRDQYLAKQTGHTSGITMFVKIFGVILAVVLGGVYVIFEMQYLPQQVALMCGGFLFVLTLSFAVFVRVSFGRVAVAMSDLMQALPAFKMAKAVVINDWFRAMMLLPSMPVLPMILALSWVNQRVRVCRGLYSDGPRDTDGGARAPGRELKVSDVKDFGSLALTPRVHVHLDRARSWDWLGLAFRVYVLVACYLTFLITPIFMNVGLAWLAEFLRDFPFWTVIFTTFVVGVVAFMLPMVPGAVVYIFGGLILSKTCPPLDTDTGFWTGAIINIFLSWVLKLTACALQQEGIGGLLGTNTWVRSTVGVHKVGVRCIEAVLRKPGLSMGKVAILCGGPDWPVSVMAGVLRLSLFECLVGTMPIIVFIAPFALTGSFYVKSAESAAWGSLANLMFLLSGAVTLAFGAVAAWAVQTELELNHDELTRPLAQNVDLEWLDHKNSEIATRTHVAWTEISSIRRGLYIAGALIHGVCWQAFYWGPTYLFGSFEVSDDLDDLVWYGDGFNGLFTIYSVMVLGIYFVAFAFLWPLTTWKKKTQASGKAQATKELDAQEADWKTEYLRKVENWGKEEELVVQPESPSTKALCSCLSTSNKEVAEDADAPLVGDRSCPCLFF